MEGLIRIVLNRYRIQDEKTSGTSRIINIALANTIVPSYYLKAFFDFVYDIYKLNFEYKLTNELYDDFIFAYDGLRNMMISGGNEVQVNVIRKSYKLIKST